MVHNRHTQFLAKILGTLLGRSHFSLCLWFHELLYSGRASAYAESDEMSFPFSYTIFFVSTRISLPFGMHCFCSERLAEFECWFFCARVSISMKNRFAKVCAFLFLSGRMLLGSVCVLNVRKLSCWSLRPFGRKSYLWWIIASLHARRWTTRYFIQNMEIVR